MSRKKISEFRAKTILNKALNANYNGVSLDKDSDWQSAINNLDDAKAYVLKVDQAEKGRFKKGLVKLDLNKSDIAVAATEIFNKGYKHLILEEQKQYEQNQEKYLSLERNRDGVKVSFSEFGGVDIESHPESIKSLKYVPGVAPEGFAAGSANLDAIAKAFEDNHVAFLEINPYVVDNGQMQILDAAVEIDDEADFFTEDWSESDIRSPRTDKIVEEEQNVKELNQKSQASFSLEVINPNGAIWLLLSGGGASVVVADEVHNLGQGNNLGNYGEYSGNPNTEETRHYTDQLLKIIFKSTAQKKVLLIAGGVANFTDVAKTFKGIIEAFDNNLDEIKNQNLAVVVRRGGPNQKQGLALIKDYLDKNDIKNDVSGPEIILSEVVQRAIKLIGDVQ